MSMCTNCGKYPGTSEGRCECHDIIVPYAGSDGISWDEQLSTRMSEYNNEFWLGGVKLLVVNKDTGEITFSQEFLSALKAQLFEPGLSALKAELLERETGSA